MDIDCYVPTIFRSYKVHCPLREKPIKQYQFQFIAVGALEEALTQSAFDLELVGRRRCKDQTIIGLP